MTSNKRRPEENIALTIAEPLFKNIYGTYNLIQEVTDKPDAAFKTHAGKSIGVEIVGLDSNEYLHYTNKAIKHLERNIPQAGNKNYVGVLGTTRIHLLPEVTARNIVNKKNNKYESYTNSSVSFDEIILLIHTKVVNVTDRLNFPSQAYLYALEKGFRDGGLKFDRAMLVNIEATEYVDLYQRNHQKIRQPKNFRASDWLDGSHYLDQKLHIVHFGDEGGEIFLDGGLTDVNKIIIG
jgi:hypothetical protein